MYNFDVTKPLSVTIDNVKYILTIADTAYYGFVKDNIYAVISIDNEIASITGYVAKVNDEYIQNVELISVTRSTTSNEYAIRVKNLYKDFKWNSDKPGT